MKNTSDKPLVSVVIPTHNRRKKLSRLLDSLLKSNFGNLEIIVVDDTSTDGTSEELKNFYPDVRCVRNERERMLAGSRNIGMRNSRGELIFLIDDDNVVAEDTVGELVHIMLRNADVGVAGPVMYYLGDPSLVWCATVNINRITSWTRFPERNNRHIEYKRILDTYGFPNAFMVRKSAVKRVGMFDVVNFPIHYDEADFCNRVKSAGFRVVLVPTARIWHDVPLMENWPVRRFGVHTNERAFYTARNRILFQRKYSGKLEFLSFVALFLPLISAVYIKTILSDPFFPLGRRLSVAKSYIIGIAKGFGTKLAL